MIVRTWPQTNDVTWAILPTPQLFAGYKTNGQKYIAFLYTKNEISEKDMERTIPFAIATKRIKYLGINLTKDMKDPYTKTTKHY